jgi:hypothetical protein
MLRFRVDPPTVQPVPHGLLDVAEVVTRDDPHWRTGIEYDSYACTQAKLWGRWCTAIGTPATLPDARTIAIALTGQLTAGTYSMLGAAGDNDGPRQLLFTYYDEGVPTETAYVTGTAPVTVASDDEPLNGHLVITDVLTGLHVDWNIVQDATTGEITHPGEEAILWQVPQPAIPEGCESITTTITAQDATPAEGVAFAITSAGVVTSERAVTIAGHRVVLDAGDTEGALVIASGVGEGVWPISVHDIDSGSFVSGWIYIDDTLAGTAVLLQATCPVKEIRSAPWTTLFAPAWTVYAEVQCQSMAFDDAAASASDVFALAEAKVVEASWWDLAFDRARTIGTGLSIPAAIAELEHYLAVNYNGLGIIHVPVYMAAWLGSVWGTFTRGQSLTEHGVLHTLRGTPVVVGSGYPRQGDPAGAGVAIMATGAVRLYRSGVEVISTIDRRTNLRSAVAERTYAAADDCVQPAVAFVDVEATT